MKVVYGVAGEGLGHVFEAIEIIDRLRREGHAVKVLTFGERACASLQAFGPTRIEGVHLYTNAKGFSLAATFARNLRIFPFYLRHWRRLRREIEAFEPDVFVTAYEPFTTLVAHVLRRPLISMDNQNELLHLPPGGEPPTFALRLVQLATRICTYGADYYLVKSLAKPACHEPRVRFVSPIIQSRIRQLVPRDGAHVLVYLTKPNPDLIGVLRSLEETFFVYCHNRVGDEGNVHYRAQGEGFLRDLQDCKAIIGTTGFSLISDSIYLRKPYFGVPLRKQFEQTHNARFLRNSGLGTSSETPTADELRRFLAGLPAYRERLARYRLDPTEQEETLLALLGAAASGGRAAPVTAAFP
jgi:uncharacterized protein (TIGR00661 family)